MDPDPTEIANFLIRAKLPYSFSALDQDPVEVTRSNKKERIRRIQCKECMERFSKMEEYWFHLTNLHNKDIEFQHQEFDTFDEFMKWKLGVEEKGGSNYVQRYGAEKNLHLDKEMRNYFCHRSFDAKIISNRTRRMKSSGSVKSGHVCPSVMYVVIRRNKVSVKYCSSHLYHDGCIGKQRLPKDQRTKIAGKLSMGVPEQRVLDDVRNRTTLTEFNRLDLLEKKDIHNIKRDFGISHSTKQHENDAVSVQLFVQRCRSAHSNPVLYFKPQNEQDKIFHSTDFLLVIMTDFQAEMLQAFGNKKICVDSTHGLNSYDFLLHTVVVVDEYGNGIPVAFCFSNRKDSEMYEFYFDLIKSKVGNIITDVFMSDDDAAIYNGWYKCMGPAKKRLLCAWHVIHSWKNNLGKIANNEKKVVVFATLKSILRESNEIKFKKELREFVRNLFLDPDTSKFGLYFQRVYLHRTENWAYCYRIKAGINTNMYLEALHKKIKYCYLEGKKCRRLDRSLDALIKLIRDLVYERLIKAEKNKRTDKMRHIEDSHERSKSITANMIEVAGLYTESWNVVSQSDPAIKYLVKKQVEVCSGPCLMKCVPCNICIHSYECNCLNYLIHFNICKHIHACITNQCKINNVCSRSLLVPTCVAKPENVDLSCFEYNAVNNLKSKIELMMGLHQKYGTRLGNGDIRQIERHIDASISVYNNCCSSSTMPLTSTSPKKKHITPQNRMFSTKRKRAAGKENTGALISNNITRMALFVQNENVLNVAVAFDHTYSLLNPAD